MSEVKICKLSEVITIQNGYAFASKKFTADGGTPLIRIRDLKNGQTTQTNYSGDFDEDYLVNSGDLLIGMDGEFRCYEWKGAPALLNQRVCRIQSRSDAFDLKYLYYGINSYLKAIEDVTGYTTVKHLSSSTILNIEFPVPSLEKQHEIVEKLDSAFAEIEELKNNTIIQRQANKMLTSQTIWNLLNDSKLEREDTTLDKICDNLDNQRIPITRDVRASGEFPYYGASGIIDYVEDFIFEGDALLVSEDGANLLARSTPIAFSVTGKYWVNNHAHILKFTDPHLQKYVEYVLENTKLDKYITGAAQPKLTQRALNIIPIKIPVNRSDIKSIMETITTFSELATLFVDNLNVKLELADELKSSTLSNYFGQLVA